MLPLSYAPPHPRPNRWPSHKPKPRPFPCALPFPDALRAAAAAAAISLSLLAGNAAGAAAAVEQAPEICRDVGGGGEAEVKAEAVTNEQLVEEAWEVVNEGFLPDAGNRPWSPEIWMQRKQDILQGSVKSRSRAHEIVTKMLASLGDPYTRFLSPSDVSYLQVGTIYAIDLNITHMGDEMALPLSMEASEEYTQITEILHNHTFTPEPDIRTYVWGGTNYTAARFYKFIHAQVDCDLEIKSIWNSKCLPKLKVFLWLMLHDRVNTKDLMSRKHWQIDGGPNCILCTQGSPETRDHLFFDCPMAIRCWDYINIQWNANASILVKIREARNSFTGPCFLETFACATWNLWKMRNDFIFQHQPPSFVKWKVRFQSDLCLHRHRVKEPLIQPLFLWARALDS